MKVLSLCGKGNHLDKLHYFQPNFKNPSKIKHPLLCMFTDNQQFFFFNQHALKYFYIKIK